MPTNGEEKILIAVSLIFTQIFLNLIGKIIAIISD